MAISTKVIRILVLSAAAATGGLAGYLRMSYNFNAQQETVDERFFSEARNLVCFHKHFGDEVAFERSLQEWQQLALQSRDPYKLEVVQQALAYKGQFCSSK